VSSQVIPPVTHATPFVLRITRLPVGRRASGFVLVAQCLVIRPEHARIAPFELINELRGFRSGQAC
jgi:hypothetical protein